ncbi:MAG TPA: POTRA domain-containing protein [Gammaproteobacteria bacterium]|nr:POTRA domain-containing protein [Gammaproteobacteria bacterium]
MSKIPFKLVAATTLLMLAQNAAFAAVAGGGLPGSAMPEQVGKALYNQQPSSTEQGPSGIAPPKPHEAESPLGAQAQKIKFKLNGIVLEGNHVYSDAQLRALYQDQIGKVISVADLFNIVQSITNFYRNNGYIISRAILPPQHVKNGVVHVQIIEGYIGNVDVAGNPRGAKCLLEAYGEQIKACRPLKIDRMTKYMLIANETPATRTKAVLSPSKTEVGAADLTLVADNSPITGYLSYDNYGTRYIGPQQMTANLGINSFITSGDSTQLTVTKTPKGQELTYVDLNYNAVVSSGGIRWLVGGTRVGTHPLFVLTASDIEGVNYNYYTSLQIPVIRTPSSSFTWQLSFNYLDSDVTTFNQELYVDHIRSVGIGGTYNFADRWYGSNLIYADIRQGLPIFGYTTDTNPNTALTSHPGGQADYTKLDVQASRLQAIKGPVSLYGMIKGQYGFSALLASEQFSYGGSQLGRGYDVAEFLGDRGLAGSLELRYDLGVGKLFIQSLEFYLFYDAGILWTLDPPVGTQARQSATSTGVGVRFFMNKYISGNVMWAQPLTAPVLALQETNQVVINGQTFNKGNGFQPRVFFSIVATLE